jgi:hypothetical protein
MAAGGNKNALNRAVGPDGHRDWSFGLFDCFDECGVCTSSLGLTSYILADPLSLSGCCAVWCPCVVFGKNKQRLNHLQSRGTPLAGGGESGDGDCAIYGCLLIPNCAWILQVC